jgi:hypothetical protein
MARPYKIVGLLTLIMLAVLGLYGLWPREPSVKDKTFHEWVVDLESSQPEQRALARNAIQKMGRKAVPYVIALLKPPQPTWREKFMAFIKFRTRTKIRPLGAGAQSERRSWGFAACDVLGPVALDAAPVLQQIFHQGRDFDAGYALARLGPKAVLFPAGQQGDYFVRVTALYFMEVRRLPGEGLPERFGPGASFRERARAHHDRMLAVWWPKHNATNPAAK